MQPQMNETDTVSVTKNSRTVEEREEIDPYLKSDCFALCGFFLEKKAANSLPVLAYESCADGSVALRLFFTSRYSIRRTCMIHKPPELREKSICTVATL